MPKTIHQGREHWGKILRHVSPFSKLFSIFRPLHISASRHLVDTCELLLIKGATVSVADNRGLTPALAVAPSDDAVTCLTMILEALKMEIQTGSYAKSEAIKAARRSASSIGKIGTVS